MSINKMKRTKDIATIEPLREEPLDKMIKQSITATDASQSSFSEASATTFNLFELPRVPLECILDQLRFQDQIALRSISTSYLIGHVSHWRSVSSLNLQKTIVRLFSRSDDSITITVQQFYRRLQRVLALIDSSSIKLLVIAAANQRPLISSAEVLLNNKLSAAMIDADWSNVETLDLVGCLTTSVDLEKMSKLMPNLQQLDTSWPHLFYEHLQSSPSNHTEQQQLLRTADAENWRQKQTFMLNKWESFVFGIFLKLSRFTIRMSSELSVVKTNGFSLA